MPTHRMYCSAEDVATGDPMGVARANLGRSFNFGRPSVWKSRRIYGARFDKDKFGDVLLVEYKTGPDEEENE